MVRGRGTQLGGKDDCGGACSVEGAVLNASHPLSLMHLVSNSFVPALCQAQGP